MSPACRNTAMKATKDLVSRRALYRRDAGCSLSRLGGITRSVATSARLCRTNAAIPYGVEVALKIRDKTYSGLATPCSRYVEMDVFYFDSVLTATCSVTIVVQRQRVFG